MPSINHRFIMNILQKISKACFIILFITSPFSCSNDNKQPATKDQNPPVELDTTQNSNTGNTSFRLLSPTESGISFSNEINEDFSYNILTFEYLYNGGGVAIGDINNDGLQDIYFSGTFVSNKLYLNKGNLKFEDITDKAGVNANDGFKTGVTMADINADGWLDIFVCRTSKADDGKKDNQVYINNGDLTFTESAAKLGLKDNSNSNHANFFDYDLDGDLDLYLLNHRLGFKDAVRLRLAQNKEGNLSRQTDPMTPFESDRLYRNDNGKFTDVSKAAGIENSAFGLSATISDINNDGYPDIYVANDYIEPDYVYINNGNGTFTDKYPDYIRHSSQNSMGSDLSDFNNDGLLDIIVLDMIADDDVRYKQLMNIMQLERYETLVKYGYGHQVARNVVQLNNGNGTFSEMGQLAGVSNTDWSWGAFFADFDNDGYKDIYIGNGYKRDVTDMDYMTYTRDSIEKTGGVTQKRFPDINQFLDLIPSTKLQNYMFRNNGDLTFENVSDKWGLTQKTFSNGTAYADLDNDGDLDLVTNNIEDPAFIYENKTSGNNYLQVSFEGSKNNKLGIGTKVTLHMSDGSMQYQEMTTNRGFFSASQAILHFGLGNKNTVEKLTVQWLDGKTQVIENPKSNQHLILKHADASNTKLASEATPTPLFQTGNQAQFTHEENEFQDFNRERLIPHKLSRLGPHLAVGDINGDNLEDFFIGNAMGNPSAMFIQNSNGSFVKKEIAALEKDKFSEDMDAVFFDADGDKDLDLYVVSGGGFKEAGNLVYQDRLYINDGAGNFTKAKLPTINASGSCVSAYDYDGDGDTDLFVGGRHVPGRYPTIPQSYILQNDKGQFTDVTDKVCADFKNIGMITDIQWGDLDGDQKEEMIVSGEWMPITVFKNDGNKLSNISAQSGTANSNGWWNCLALEDFDKDGDLDIVSGNLGQNTRLKASETAPIALIYKDFDNNGGIEPIMAYTKNGELYPFAGRDALTKQISKIKKNYPRYEKYGTATVEDIFTKSAVASAARLDAKTFKTTYFENDGKGNFTAKSLPYEAQMAPVKNILSDDFNKDGNSDILLIGNDSSAETETGVYDAFNGVLLLGNGKGNFTFAKNKDIGLWASHEARDIKKLQLANGSFIYLVANNNAELQILVAK
jgi:enediyne biosynthesis protein E4